MAMACKELFVILLKEVPTAQHAWNKNGKLFTAQEMVAGLEQNSMESQEYVNKVVALVAAMLGAPEKTRDIDYNTVPARQMFTEILKELPSDKVVWKTMSGNFTAQNLLDDFNDFGQEFASSIFRLARDMVARKSTRA